MYNEVYQTRW